MKQFGSREKRVVATTALVYCTRPTCKSSRVTKQMYSLLLILVVFPIIARFVQLKKQEKIVYEPLPYVFVRLDGGLGN